MYECGSTTKIINVNPWSQLIFTPEDYPCNTKLPPRRLYISITYQISDENIMKFYYDEDFNNPDNLVTSIIFNIVDNHITFDPKENRQHPGIKIENLDSYRNGITIIWSRITVEFTINNSAVIHGFVKNGDIYTFPMRWATNWNGDSTVEVSVNLFNNNSISVNS